ncbi:GNAT family N-acetyltransferase [Streptomyces monticola]|uniref:GNAT family N-acetyltransferase n=1 Tax=Streptomyces monticola TaxID=2666263 RepID=A0ABW2JH55_9ACTN
MADTEELVRLRAFLLGSGPGSGSGHYVARTSEEAAAWRHNYRAWLAKLLPGSDAVHVAVIDGTDGLAACAIAVVDQRAPTHLCPDGQVGWVQTVVVDPAMRRRGLGLRVMGYVMDWFQERGIRTVFLQTTSAAADLYTRIGFQPTGEDTMIAVLSPPLNDDREALTS